MPNIEFYYLHGIDQTCTMHNFKKSYFNSFKAVLSHQQLFLIKQTIEMTLTWQILVNRTMTLKPALLNGDIRVEILWS